MHRVVRLVSLLIAAAPLPATAQALDPEALKLISETAAQICGDFAREGSASETSVEGSAEARLKGLAGRLVDLGVEGAGKIGESDYAGVLRDQLGDELKDVRACRLEVFRDLSRTLTNNAGAPREQGTGPGLKNVVATPAPANYRFPFTATVALAPADLVSFGPDELRWMRNEIYAKHGYIFRSADLRGLFEAMPWYRPITPDAEAVWQTMSELERANVLVIKAAEAGR